jgi:hypothetical protein
MPLLPVPVLAESATDENRYRQGASGAGGGVFADKSRMMLPLLDDDR